ncbi:MAG: hypothetical protein INQ03_24855 [Candidatus Heimdallarchaeota archaeon]|nr:hypothetical protein [Candidatus Heimdallarchaeota archaeon]
MMNPQIKYLFVIMFIVSLLPTGAYQLDGTYQSIDGTSKDFSSFEGELLMIEAFSTTCSHCIEMAEILENIWPSVKSDINFLSLSTNGNDDLDTLKEFNASYPMYWEVGLDTEEYLEAWYDAIYTPTMIFVNAEGDYVNCFVGTQQQTIFLKEINDFIEDPIAYANTVEGSGCDNPENPTENLLYLGLGGTAIIGTYFIITDYIKRRKN